MLELFKNPPENPEKLKVKKWKKIKKYPLFF